MLDEQLSQSKTLDKLIKENTKLQASLDEAEETLNAIRNGEVDAIVTPQGSDGPKVYTLESADSLYRNLVQEMSEGVATLTFDGIIFYSNAQLATLLQVPLDKIIGQKLNDFILPDDLKTYKAIFDIGLKTRCKSEIRLKSLDGTVIPVMLSINNLKDLKGVYAVITDLSEQKHQEELNKSLKALEVSEERYRSIIENVQDAYIRADTEGIIILASPSAARMYRYNSPQEMIGIPALSLYKNVQSRNSLIKKLKKHDKVEDYESEALRKDGTSFLVSLSSQFHYDPQGQILGTEAFVRDITERKNTEKALEYSNQKISEILNSIQDDFYVLDHNWNFVHVSKQFASRINKVPKDFVGQNIWKMFPKHIGTPFEENFKAALAEREIRRFETYGKYTDKWFNMTVFPSSEGITVIGTDITQRKQAEEKIESTLNRLKQSNKELEQFAYITSHDLREPLRMITSFLQLLERRYKDQLDSDANEFIEFAVNGAKHLDAMTIDLLEYSKISSQKSEVALVNFEHVLEEALMNLKVPIEENNAVITHDPLPTINGNKQLKVQLFQNLIGNAIKYRSQEPPKIHISAKKEKNQYLFNIEDNGIGMSSEHLKRIFTIFQRLHTSEEYEGTGIGLAIAQKIVHQQGGKIWAESELGNGSTFYFTMPQ